MNNVLFCGFGVLGKNCLSSILERGYNVKYVLTHKENKENSVDTFSKNNNLKFDYSDLRKNTPIDLEKYLNNNEIDYLISVNYRYIFSDNVLSKVKYPINIHASLLPKYRGRTPHIWAIINGEKECGITVHLMDKEVDSGDIILQEKIEILDSYTGNDLLEILQNKYPDMLVRALENINNKKKFIKQKEEDATYFGKRIEEMGYISFYNCYKIIYNFVRAQAYPYPGAYYYLSDGRKIIIDKIKVSDKKINEPIGKIKIIDGKFYVNCIDETIILDKIRY